MAEERVKEFKGPGKGPRGPRPKLDHPMQTFLRIMRYLMKYYPVHMSRDNTHVRWILLR